MAHMFPSRLVIHVVPSLPDGDYHDTAPDRSSAAWRFNFVARCRVEKRCHAAYGGSYRLQRVMVVTPVLQTTASDRISIWVPASSSIVLPSKKVISAPETLPVFIVSPTFNSIWTVASIQSFVCAFNTNTSPSAIESIVSVEGHGDPRRSSLKLRLTE